MSRFYNGFAPTYYPSKGVGWRKAFAEVASVWRVSAWETFGAGCRCMMIGGAIFFAWQTVGMACVWTCVDKALKRFS